MNTPHITRRHFLALGAGGLVLTACSRGSNATPALIGSNDPRVEQRELQREVTGARRRQISMVAAPTSLDLGHRVVETWAYDETVPGSTVRLTAGERLELRLRNDLPEDTTIHWHGLALRNDMDGVHDVTQAPIRPGETFTYAFIAPDPGTYWFHPHMGLQLDRGLYAPLVIEDPNEPLNYDVDELIVLDDWLDGIDTTPEATMEALGSMGGDGKMDHSAMPMFQSEILGGDAGDVDYPLHLINGRPRTDPSTIVVPAGGRARLRIINAGSDTAYRVALGGHQMTVTHADGFPVNPVQVDTLLVGMGERYDVLVSPSSGAWPLVALAEGKSTVTSAVVRTSDAAITAAPPSTARPAELGGRLLTYADLTATDEVRLAAKDPDIEHRIALTGSMMPYQWAFDGMPFPEHEPLIIDEGQRVRFTFTNTSSMWHPIHLHGHTFRVGTDAAGPRKDTLNVLPGEEVSVDFEADNPGQWMLHCHNTFHLERGMALVVGYSS